MKYIRAVVLVIGTAVLLIAVSACFLFTNPTASFTILPEGGRAPLRVEFDGGSSYDPNGEVEAYQWSFGDGSTAKGKTAEHTYETPGNYTAVLEVEDDSGARDTDSRVIRVTAAPGIFAITVAAYVVCTSGNVSCDPDAAVGPPDAPLGSAHTTAFHVSLGADDGYITALMDTRFTDGPGPDLRIYEVGKLQGGIDESFDVWISPDGVIWEQVASNVRNDSGRVYASIDIAGHAGGFSWVRIVDRGKDTSNTPGADIDAVEALYRDTSTPEDESLRGLDVNATQGSNIDWSAVYGAGYRFVYVKATSGDADPPALRNDHFENQADGAKAAGLAVGVYHFAYPETNSPEDEAAYFLDEAGDYVREAYLRPALDIEALSQPAGQMANGASLSDWIRVWMESVEAATGVEPLLYTTSDYAKNYLAPGLADEETGYDVWIAHWRCNSNVPPDCGAWSDRWAFWQYWAPTEFDINGCGHNSVPGIGGDVDLDIFNGAMSQLSEYVIEQADLPDDSLVAYYDFDEAVGTTLLDRSRYLNNGEIQQIEGVVPGRIGNAYSFDGTDDYVEVSSSESLQISSAVTIEAWILLEGLTASPVCIIVNKEGVPGHYEIPFEIGILTYEPYSRFLGWHLSEPQVTTSAQDVGDDWHEGGGPIPLNQWTHVALTYDGAMVRTYLNGNLQREYVTTGKLYENDHAVRIGARGAPGNPIQFFRGAIDELRIYSRALSQSELHGH